MRLKFVISHELLEQILQLPPTARINGFLTEGTHGGPNVDSTIFIEDDSLPKNIDYVAVNPTTTKEGVTWNWNLPKAAADV